jgi:hypothetical protein
MSAVFTNEGGSRHTYDLGGDLILVIRKGSTPRFRYTNNIPYRHGTRTIWVIELTWPYASTDGSRNAYHIGDHDLLREAKYAAQMWMLDERGIDTFGEVTE